MERESPEDRGSERTQPGVTASGSRGQSSSVRDVDAPPCATQLRPAGLVRCEPYYASYGYGLHRPTNLLRVVYDAGPVSHLT
jgi:hypothetical protein